MYEKLLALVSQLLEEKRGPGLVCSETLELPLDPRHERQVDVSQQRVERRRRISSVIPNPSPQERIELLGDVA
jgi:hypothetical protein